MTSDRAKSWKKKSLKLNQSSPNPELLAHRNTCTYSHLICGCMCTFNLLLVFCFATWRMITRSRTKLIWNLLHRIVFLWLALVISSVNTGYHSFKLSRSFLSWFDFELILCSTTFFTLFCLIKYGTVFPRVYWNCVSSCCSQNFVFFISGNINLTEIHFLDNKSANNLKEIDILL